MKNNNSIEFKKFKHLSVLSDSNHTFYSKEINLISWDGKEPKIDIRTWRGSRALKGITLEHDEVVKLSNALNVYLRESGTSSEQE